MLIYTAVVFLMVAAVRMLARTLPAQNVALIMAGLIAWEMALETLWNGPNWLWRGWMFWPAMIVLVRLGCRWLLRRDRQDWNYGLWLLLLAGALAALAQFGFALDGTTWVTAGKLASIRFASTAFCLFWLSPFFVSKLPQQPQERAQ